ncbi:sublancin family glycopeptide [Rossellomorea arthrocnemi]
MKELMKDLCLEELETIEGGAGYSTNAVAGPPTGGGSGDGGIGAAQCAYFWSLCFSGASDTYGCGSTYQNCKYYEEYC